MKSFKRFLPQILLLCLCMVFYACEEKDKVSVAPSNITLGSNGGSVTILISSNTSWLIYGVPDWLNVNPVQGSGDVMVTLTATPSTNDRNCSLIVKAGEAMASLLVSQQGGKIEYDPIVGVWYGSTKQGRMNQEMAELTFHDNHTASFVWYDDDSRTPDEISQYSWEAKGSIYTMKFVSSDRNNNYFGDLRITYLNESSIIVTAWAGTEDESNWTFKKGALDISLYRTQESEVKLSDLIVGKTWRTTPGFVGDQWLSGSEGDQWFQVTFKSDGQNGVAVGWIDDEEGGRANRLNYGITESNSSNKASVMITKYVIKKENGQWREVKESASWEAQIVNESQIKLSINNEWRLFELVTTDYSQIIVGSWKASHGGGDYEELTFKADGTGSDHIRYIDDDIDKTADFNYVTSGDVVAVFFKSKDYNWQGVYDVIAIRPVEGDNSRIWFNVQGEWTQYNKK